MKLCLFILLWILAFGCIAGAQVNLPVPSEWAAPAGAPNAPGDSYSIAFSNPPIDVDPDAPVISEWNKTVKPGESFTLTGTGFTKKTGVDFGTDTSVWVWADNGMVGTLVQASIWKVTDQIIVATLPSGIPFGMYLVWVENSYGASAPICLNRPTALWIGPMGNTAPAGSTKRVFGKNVSHDHGKVTSYVYIQPASGGTLTQCIAGQVDPYSVSFTVPPGIADGNYNLYVHNGHGGPYGWSDPLAMVVGPDWARGPATRAVNPNGTDDLANLQAAVNYLNAQPNGGTLTLGSGVYKISAELDVTSNVKVLGAGRDQTTIELRFTKANQHDGIRFFGSHPALEQLTVKNCVSTNTPIYGVIGSDWPTFNSDLSIRDVRWTGEAGTGPDDMQIRSNRGEIANCDGFRYIRLFGNDWWLHGSTFHGGLFTIAEAGIAPGAVNQLVVEDNQFQTDNWAATPTSTSIWCIRLLTFDPGYGSCVNSYIGNNNSMDVAPKPPRDMNKGEMILFHPAYAAWYGQAVSTSSDGKTVTLRTDGKVDGRVTNIMGFGPGTTVPDTYGNLTLDGQVYALIGGGTGLGQARKVVSHTSSSVTVDSPFRISPDSTSKLVLMSTYNNQVAYNNTLNAFPPGYSCDYSASSGVQFGGNCFDNVAEANTSYRTWGARAIFGAGNMQSYWNEMRGEISRQVQYFGTDINAGTYNGTYPASVDAFGPFTLGNMVRGGEVEVSRGPWTGSFELHLLGSIVGISMNGTVPTVTTNPTGQLLNVGNVFEGIYAHAGTNPYGSKRGIIEDDASETLFRNNDITVANATVNSYDPGAPLPVYISANAKPFLSGNTYHLPPGWNQTYYKSASSALAQKPVPLMRVARFKGAVGWTFNDVIVPIANAGISTISTLNAYTGSYSWISATPGSSIAADGMGQLAVNVDSTQMSEGRYVGTITVVGGSVSVGVGVVVDILPATTVGKLKDLKSLDDGTLVNLTTPKVAIVASGVYSDGSIYVCESDRTCGLKVMGAVSVGLWDNLTLNGIMGTDMTTGERVLNVNNVGKASGSEIGNLGMSNSTVTATGQFIRVWGRVTGKTDSYLTLDDGSRSPTKVQIDGLIRPLATTPSLGQYVSAAGPAARLADGTPVVRVRCQTDISIY